MSDDFKAFIAKVAAGNALTRDEASQAFDRMMSGEATPSQMGGLLMAMRVRGETVDEITGAASTMRAKMTKVAAPPDAIDVVGTGGDASGSYNVSTCAALIVAGCGVPVAKHGNRALSSKSGAADVLGALGVKIELRPDEITRCIYEAGYRLHVRAGAPSGDQERRADAGRARHPHDLQPARTDLQSGGRQAPDDRRILAAMDRADCASARSCSAPKASGWRMAPTVSTRSPRPARPTSRRWRTAWCGPSTSIRRTSALRAPSPRR